MKQIRRHKIGSVILAIAALSLSGASTAMLAQAPDVSTALGRLLCAGAFANLSLSAIMALIAIFPIRQGDKWAFWALCLPVGIYGIPMLILDATNVAQEHLVSTLAPQVMGLLLLVIGLFLVAPRVFQK